MMTLRQAAISKARVSTVPILPSKGRARIAAVMTDTYIRPIPLTDPCLHGGAVHRLAGGWVRFSHVERLRRGAPPEVVAAADLSPSALDRLTAPRAAVAGLTLDAPRLMGILNVTPDSFSDGGRFSGEAALAHARAMLEAGADLVDIGGESTRPGAPEIAVEEEIARTSPIIAGLRAAGVTAPISLDSRKAAVARAGLSAGADIVNDVSGLRHDPALADVAAETGAPLILMHSIGTPETMQGLAATSYDDILLDVFDGLAAAIAQAEAAGVDRARILVDPGIGFGKTLEQNLALIRRLGLFHALGCGILLGVSRKGMIGQISGERQADRRGPGSAAIGLWAVQQGIQMLRVHDIGIHKQALDLWQAVAAPGPPETQE
jgi:dihydropteroate synthase